MHWPVPWGDKSIASMFPRVEPKLRWSVKPDARRLLGAYHSAHCAPATTSQNNARLAQVAAAIDRRTPFYDPPIWHQRPRRLDPTSVRSALALATLADPSTLLRQCLRVLIEKLLQSAESMGYIAVAGARRPTTARRSGSFESPLYPPL
uniref:Uncharacterized protein n=1 Tax=Plectus sambesii TaxID=2011161 RepID=A0A914W247_9BILA